MAPIIQNANEINNDIARLIGMYAELLKHLPDIDKRIQAILSIVLDQGQRIECMQNEIDDIQENLITISDKLHSHE